MSSEAWASSYSALSAGGAAGPRRDGCPGGGPADRGRGARGRPEAPERRSRSSSPGTPPTPSRSLSSENLFVDVAAQGKGDLPRSSNRFLDGLRRYEGQPLETIDEVVGFAKSGIGKGSVASGVFTLVASAMGAGCLSLPHMFRESGIGLGLMLLACGALLAHIGLVVLMSCARYTECRSFAELVSLSLGGGDGRGPGRSRSVDVVIALYGLAAVLIYMMLIGDFFEGIAHSAVIGYGGVSRRALILISLVLVFPLSVPKSVTALRYISILSTASIAFMTVVVMLKTPSFLRAPEASGYIRWFRGGTCSTLRSFSMALFAFSAHTNAVPVATALDQPRASVIWRVSSISVLIELAIYSLIAACGYLCFLDDTKQDIIRNYSDDDRVMFIVRCVYAVPVVLGVPINLSPAVGSMKALAQGAFGMARLPSATSDSRTSGRSLSKTSGGTPSNGLVGRIQHVGIIIAVLGVCTTVAIWCEAIADVIALFGSCFGTLICLVWPCQIYRAVCRKLHPGCIGVLVGNALLLATLIGILSFALQAFDFTRGALGGSRAAS